jgi:esterase/lipase superfamily enzyme
MKSAIITLHLLVATALIGCSSGPKLPKTPNLYLQAEVDPLDRVPADRRTTEVDILYATDRMPNDSTSLSKRYYDERRSDSLAVGSVTVRFGEDLEWDDLLRESLASNGKNVPLEITKVEELVRFPSTLSYPVWSDDGQLVHDPEFLAASDASEQALRNEVSQWLTNTNRKDVYVYIHGVGNSFSDPMYRMAELWHYLGRPGVPVAYTWPALKGGGPLRGYTYARESSEFTVYHLRQFLLTVASCPDVERIHILAHSRGTGVTLSVLRDLRLLYMDNPDLGLEELKLGNIILAAPDIDLQVAQQRFRPDEVYKILGRLTVYASPEDSALGIAEFLFRSMSRVGALSEKDMSPEQIDAMKGGRIGFDLIEIKVKQRGAHGHTYWIDNPSVLSDVILILRDDRSAGPEYGRPMVRTEVGMWEIHDGYPFAGPHAETEER